MITEISSFKTSDGQLFDNLQDAEAHEGELAVRKLYKECSCYDQMTVDQFMEVLRTYPATIHGYVSGLMREKS